MHCNWKGFLEVFNEYYHLPFVHPNSIDSVYAHPEPHDEVTGCYASQFGRTEGTGGLMQSMQAHALPAMETIQKLGIQGARYTWLFPNMTFAASGEALWVYEATPLGADRSRVVQSVCFHERPSRKRTSEVKVQPYYDRMDAALGKTYLLWNVIIRASHHPSLNKAASVPTSNRTSPTSPFGTPKG